MEESKVIEEEKIVEVDTKGKFIDCNEEIEVDHYKFEDVGGGYQPLLLEESTLEKLPIYIKHLLLGLDVNNYTQSDLLPILVYGIALECGFMLYDINATETIWEPFWGFSFHAKNIVNLSILPDIYWELRDHIYKFDIKLINHSTKCLLLCVRTGDSFCITLATKICPGRSICLSTSRFVLSSKMKNLPSRFRNLKELSYLLKENIFVPIRNYILDETGHYYPGFMGIPVEIQRIILNQLSTKDLQMVSKTCHKLRFFSTEIYQKRRKH